jgi:ribosomal-protein-alanine N-acetyltransferase
MQIELSRAVEDFDWAAALMVSVDPWKRLGRSLEQARKQVADPDYFLAVARGPGRSLGFVVWTQKGLLNGYIRTVAVEPEFHSQGIGRALVDFAEQKIAVQSPNVFICVSSFNQRAYQLYQRLGFERVAVLEKLLISEADEWLLRKTRGPWKDFLAG